MENLEKELLEKVNEGKDLIRTALAKLTDNDYCGAKDSILSAQNTLQNLNADSYLSICYSIIGLLEYLIDKANYDIALKYIKDGEYLAKYSKSKTAYLFYEFALGTINFGECDNKSALLHF